MGNFNNYFYKYSAKYYHRFSYFCIIATPAASELPFGECQQYFCPFAYDLEISQFLVKSFAYAHGEIISLRKL